MAISEIELGRQARASSIEAIARALKCSELDLVSAKTQTALITDYAKAGEVLSNIQNLDDGMRAIALAIIYKDPSLADGVEIHIDDSWRALISKLYSS